MTASKQGEMKQSRHHPDSSTKLLARIWLKISSTKDCRSKLLTSIDQFELHKKQYNCNTWRELHKNHIYNVRTATHEEYANLNYISRGHWVQFFFPFFPLFWPKSNSHTIELAKSIMSWLQVSPAPIPNHYPNAWSLLLPVDHHGQQTLSLLFPHSPGFSLYMAYCTPNKPYQRP